VMHGRAACDAALSIVCVVMVIVAG